jgi:peptidoglycan hydrolase CwlO-like protein
MLFYQTPTIRFTKSAPALFAVFVFFAFIFSLAMYSFVYAQTASDVDNRKAKLEQDLANLEKDIADQEKLIVSKQQEGVSLERDIAILNAKIKKSNLEIKARDLEIQQLGTDISGKAQTISSLDERMDKDRKSLAQLLRRTQELDEASLVEALFSGKTLSTFYTDLDAFASVEEEMGKLFDSLRSNRDVTLRRKLDLEDKQSQEIKLRNLQKLEKNRITQNEAEKKRILTATKGQEAEYKKILKTQQKTAAQIRAELFSLRGSAAIPFGKALEYAQMVGTRMGLRPAFILGIIAEETNLGENVGTGTWSADMHPTRDVPPFKKIMENLGFDPDKMPVSKKPSYGWGGAMGPAQFIPSTWVLYAGYPKPDWNYDASKDQIRQLLGLSRPSNPWEPLDAFMAAGVLLKENGAISGDLASERLAALRYFAGWGNAKKSAYAFYGNDVMSLASKYQQQINILQGQ